MALDTKDEYVYVSASAGQNWSCVCVCVCACVCVCVCAVYDPKKTIFQELALYQSESRNFGLSGLFIEWFSNAKSLT